MIYILIQSVHLELMQIRRLKSEEFASCKTCKTYRSSLYSEKTNMYPKLIPATPIKFEHLYSPGFVILSASDSLTCFIKNPLLFYVVTICPSAVHPVGCYYFTNSNNYQSSIPSEWNVDAECPRRYSKIFVYYNFVFTSTEKSNFVAIWNLVGGGTCITGKTVTILFGIIKRL